jgi:hypothetical protein
MERFSVKTVEFIVLVIGLGILVAGTAAKADFTFGHFGSLEPPVNSESHEDGLTISADGLSLYFGSNRSDGGNWDLWMATRDTVHDMWGSATNLGPIANSPYGEGYPSLSADGLELFFCSLLWTSQRPGGVGGGDLWVTKQSPVSGTWGVPENLGPQVNSINHDVEPSISADGLSLYFTSDRPGGEGGMDLYVSTRSSLDGAWGPSVNLGPVVNSAADDMGPCIFATDLSLFFRSNRNSGRDLPGIYVTTRATVCDPWREPVSLDEHIDRLGARGVSFISPDGETAYFSVDEPGASLDFAEASILPVVDLNEDELVDGQDIQFMIDRLGENDPSCDIGPAPLGDGRVNTRDLHVLVDHIACKLLARYAFDETHGTVAHDGAGDNHATLIGDPVWQLGSSMTDGALEFDGLDDCVFTTLIMNPTDGPFSVFAWIKGGIPNQVIVSQHGGVDWLKIGASRGTLVTELRDTTRYSQPLDSQVVVSDGNWHRVGLVWDGSDRILYVDDQEVARDGQREMGYSSGVVVIGCHAANLDVDSFFSGLIDDVRVYNCAITP